MAPEPIPARTVLLDLERRGADTSGAPSNRSGAEDGARAFKDLVTRSAEKSAPRPEGEPEPRGAEKPSQDVGAKTRSRPAKGADETLVAASIAVPVLNVVAPVREGSGTVSVALPDVAAAAQPGAERLLESLGKTSAPGRTELGGEAGDVALSSDRESPAAAGAPVSEVTPDTFAKVLATLDRLQIGNRSERSKSEPVTSAPVPAIGESSVKTAEAAAVGTRPGSGSEVLTSRAPLSSAQASVSGLVPEARVDVERAPDAVSAGPAPGLQMPPESAAAAEVRGAPGSVHPAGQVGKAVSMMIRSGGDRVKIMLHPEDLGTVDVTLTMSGGHLKVVISANRPETHHQLVQNQQQLFGALTDNGTASQSPVLEFAQPNAHSERRGAFHERGGGSGRPTASEDSPERAGAMRHIDGLIDVSL